MIVDEHSDSRRVELLDETPAVELADQPHRSGDDRYAIYVVRLHWTRGNQVSHAVGRKRLAETSLDGIGITLRTLREEEQITNDSRVGILDRETRTWIVNPWAKGDTP